MIKAFKTAVLLLIATTLLVKCIQGDDDVRNKMPIYSTGDCSLPYIVNQSQVYEKSSMLNYDHCIIHAAPGSFRNSISEKCMISKYNIEGAIAEYAFVVGKKWLLFEIKRNANACVAVIPKTEWSILSNLPEPTIDAMILENKTTLDVSEKGRDKYRILINIQNYSEQFAREYMLTAINEAAKIRGYYKRRSDLEIDAYIHERRLNSGHEPVCTAKQSWRSEGVTSLTCDSKITAILNSRQSTIFGLSPEVRFEAFISLAHSSQAYRKKTYGQPKPEDVKAHLIGLRSATAKIDDASLEFLHEKYKINREASEYILDEGYALGWAYPLADSIKTNTK